MLPEKLAFSLALLGMILVLYLGHIHAWSWELQMFAVLLAIISFMVIGRVIGVISARELARNFANSDQSDLEGLLEKTEANKSKAK